MDSEPTLIIHPREGTPDLIDTPEELAKVCKLLEKSQAPVAIDVERAGGYRYSNRAYLVQIRREDVGTFLIDSDALPNLSSLNEPLGNAIWILHDADQDIASLRQTGVNIPELFDTMLAARLLGFERFGLAAVCEQVLGLTLDKNHQNDDWSTRPLPRAWLRYAALDVELLTALYRKMSISLYEQNRWDWAVAEFENILTRPPKPADPNRWRTIPGAGKIRVRRNLAILDELWHTREKLAEELDIEPTRLIKNKMLVELAMQPPRTTRQFLNVQELRRPRTRKYLDQWMAAINRGKSRSDTQLPDLNRQYGADELPKVTTWKSSDPAAHARLQLIRESVKKSAEKLGIDQEILLEPRIQRRIAWYNVRYQGADLEAYLRRYGARPWQIEIIIKSLEQTIRKM